MEKVSKMGGGLEGDIAIPEFEKKGSKIKESKNIEAETQKDNVRVA